MEEIIRKKISEFIKQCTKFEKEVIDDENNVKEEYQATIIDKYFEMFEDFEKEISTADLGIIVDNEKELIKRYYIVYYILDERIYKQLNHNMKKGQRWKFEAEIRLYMMFLKTLREILTLLGSGFSSCALARTRTLYELGVYIYIINQNTDQLSERFCKHCNVQSLNMAKAMSLNNRKDELNKYIDKFNYGKEFKNENGWASLLFPNKKTKNGKKNISFRELAELTPLGKYFYMYKMACNFVHGSLFSSLEDLDSAEEQRGKNFWNTSPSNEGINEVILFLKTYVIMFVTDYMNGLDKYEIFENMVTTYLCGKEMFKEFLTI